MSQQVSVKQALEQMFPDHKITELPQGELKVHVQKIDKFELQSLYRFDEEHNPKEIGMKRSGKGITIKVTP